MGTLVAHGARSHPHLGFLILCVVGLSLPSVGLTQSQAFPGELQQVPSLSSPALLGPVPCASLPVAPPAVPLLGYLLRKRPVQ